MILSKGVPSWGFIGIRFYLPPTHPEQERCPWGLSYASAPSQTRFTCSTRSRRHPPGQFGICTGTRFHHPLAASASYNIQKALGNALQTQKGEKTPGWSPARLQGDGRDGSRPQDPFPIPTCRTCCSTTALCLPARLWGCPAFYCH